VARTYGVYDRAAAIDAKRPRPRGFQVAVLARRQPGPEGHAQQSEESPCPSVASLSAGYGIRTAASRSPATTLAARAENAWAATAESLRAML
jgi:hypothetical protein